MITNPALGNPPTGTTGNAGVTFLQRFVPAAISVGILIGVLFFVYGLISGAIDWISSQGDKQKLETARSKITNAIIGLVILFAIYAFIALLGRFLNVDILKLTIPTIGTTK